MRHNSLQSGGVGSKGDGGVTASWRRWAVHLAVLVLVLVGAFLVATHQVSAEGPELGEDHVRSGQELLYTTETWTVAVGDTCTSIASEYGMLGHWDELIPLNAQALSDNAFVLGVTLRDCPLMPGMKVKIPWDWVPEAAKIRLVPVEDDFQHWMRTMAIGVAASLIVGAILGLVCYHMYIRPRQST